MTTAYIYKQAIDFNNTVLDTLKNKPILLNIKENNESLENQKTFVRNSIINYERDKTGFIDEETAWKIIDAED